MMLLGAGMSVDAGIPLGRELSQYLIRTASLFHARAEGAANVRNTENLDPSWLLSNAPIIRQGLIDRSWPSRHDLAIDLMDALNVDSLRLIDAAAETRIARAMVVSELRRQHPSLATAYSAYLKQGVHDVSAKRRPSSGKKTATRPLSKNVPSERMPFVFAQNIPPSTGYRSLLSFLTEDDQSLIDSCLDRFIRNRQYTTVHQLLVFLAKELRIRTFLTTNFDPLLENALSAEYREVTSYPILDFDSIPAGRLVAHQPCSVIKLHGGAHNMKIGFDLDEPMLPASLTAFMDIFHEVGAGRWPLLVVMGYSGMDGRVMSLVREHIYQAKSRHREDGPAILWLSHTLDKPPLLPDTRGDSRNALVFFQHYPDARLCLQDMFLRLRGEFPVARSHYQAVAFARRALNVDRQVAPLPEALDDSLQGRCVTLLGRPRSGVSALASRLSESVDGRRVIWIDLAEIRTVATLAQILDEQFGRTDARLIRLWRPLVLDATLRIRSLGYGRALRRDRKGGRPTEAVANETTVRDLGALRRWLQHALRRGNYLLVLDSLESFARVHESLRSLDEDWTNQERRRLMYLLRTLVGKKNAIGDSQILLAGSFSDDERNRFRQNPHSEEGQFLAFMLSHLHEMPNAPVAETVSTQVPDASTPEVRFVRGIFAACRRPVPLPVFSTISKDAKSPLWMRCLSQEAVRSVLDHFVETTGDVAPIPGGSYWLHAETRALWHRELVETGGMTEYHDALARYYWGSVYQRSKDVRAFLEFLFHRIAHIAFTPPGEQLALVRGLCASLDNETETVLARGRIPSILFLLRQLWIVIGRDVAPIVNALTSEQRHQWFRSIDTLLKFEFELLTSTGHGHSALDVQIVRLRLYAAGELPAPDENRSLEHIKGLVRNVERAVRLGPETPWFDSIDVRGLWADLAQALHAPFEWQTSVRRSRKTGHKIMTWTEQVNVDRPAYLSLAAEVTAAARFADHPNDAKRSPASASQLEIRLRAARLRAELGLKSAFPNRLLPRKSTDTIKHYSEETRKRAQEIIEDLDSHLQLCDGVAMTPRLRRHQCYLTTLKAITKSFLLAWSDEGPDGDALELLNEAENYLVRNAGAAERQALVVLRLTSAMIHIEWAEAALQSPVKPEGPDLERAGDVVQHVLESAWLNLEEADGLLGSARGEVRWRQMYLLGRARYWLCRARLGEHWKGSWWSPKQCLFRAGQHLSAAYHNCGTMTDRRGVIREWCRVLENAWKPRRCPGLSPSAAERDAYREQRANEIHSLKRRVGWEWYRQASARSRS